MGNTLVDGALYQAPADDAQMYEQYGDYTRKLLIHQGVHPSQAQDAVQDVFTYLIKRNVREMYNPEHLAEHGAKKVRCAFRTFFTRQVLLYARGIREKNYKLAARELYVLDEPGETGRTWAESLAGAWMDDYQHLSDEELVPRLRSWLALQPPAQAASGELLDLFDGLVEESRNGTPLGLSPAKRSAQLKKLRAALSGSQDAPEPSWEIGGIALGPQELKAAIEILETAKGIMVAGPLERAGHPLAKAEKKWYHPFSAEERKKFPALEIDPQTHKKPAGHVKLAVLHRLQRMLAEYIDHAPAAQLADQAEQQIAPEFPQVAVLDQPEAPPGPWEQIEATLWRLGGTLADVDACRQWALQGGMVLASHEDHAAAVHA